MFYPKPAFHRWIFISRSGAGDCGGKTQRVVRPRSGNPRPDAGARCSSVRPSQRSQHAGKPGVNITYLLMRRGTRHDLGQVAAHALLYLVAIMDCHTRMVLLWQISNTARRGLSCRGA